MGSQMPHRYSSHWQGHLWEPQVWGLCSLPKEPLPKGMPGFRAAIVPLTFSTTAEAWRKLPPSSSPPRPASPPPGPTHGDVRKGGDQMGAGRNGDSSSRFALPPISHDSTGFSGLPIWELGLTCHSLLSLHIFPPLSIPELDKLKMKVVVPTWMPRAAPPSGHSTFSTGVNWTGTFQTSDHKLVWRSRATITGQEKRSNICNR